MIQLDIPGFKKIDLENLVFDYNGTIAVDGEPVQGIKEKFRLLSRDLNIHVITADTHATVAKILEPYDCRIKIIKGPNQDRQKENFIKSLDSCATAAFGNGVNDSLMVKKAGIGIAVLMDEGCSTATLMNSDLAVKSIIDGLDLFLNPKRLTAGLRNS